MADIIQIRRDTATNFTTANPILSQGEPGYEIDTGKLKFGDGSTAWVSLGYFGGTGGNEFEDNVFRILDNSDNTKEISFEADQITTGTTREITMPDNDVDLGDIATNNAKVTNATHTGEVTGSGALSLDRTAITNKTLEVSLSGTDEILIDDGATLKKTTAQDIADLAPAGGDVTKVGTPVNNEVGVWTGDGTIEGDSNLTFDGITLSSVTVDASTSLTVNSIDVESNLNATHTGEVTGATALTMHESAISNRTLDTAPDESELLLMRNDAGALVKVSLLNVAKVLPQSFVVACSDETTGLTTGTAKVTFRLPYAFTLLEVRASVTTAPTHLVTPLTIDINESGASVLSTKLTFDSGEKTTTTATTAPVISDADLADDAEITIDIDAVGDTTPGRGLKVYLIGTIA